MNNKEIWVVGHKNPDTDSICSAIAYANFKNLTAEGKFVPKKAGEINNETAFVLDYFNVDVPKTIESVGRQIKDIDIRHNKGIDSHMSLKKAWEMMSELDVVTLPIIDENNRVEGIIVNGDIAYSYMNVYNNNVLSQARTQYKNIIETLNGKLFSGNEHAYFVKGKVCVASGSTETIKNEIDTDDLIISGNIKERQLIALDQNPSCMIVCCATDLDEEVINKAKEIDCVLLTTEYDTFTTARLINQSMPVKYFMTKENLVMFDVDDYIDEVKDVVSRIRHRDFPVVDDQFNYVGMFSRRHLMGRGRKQIILVDHNERSQAVDGIHQAEILEIIDHHRIGSLETITPIVFRNYPLGCTATIIYKLYKERGLEIEKKIAGLMCSAILSDTLMFRSPTCTEFDKKTAEELAKIAGIDIEKFALSMFEAGSDFGEKPIEEIFYSDFKTFASGDIKFGVSQVSAVTDNQLNSVKSDIVPAMKEAARDKKLDMVFVMLTNIIDERSQLIHIGDMNMNYVKMSFPDSTMDGDTLVLEKVVSRKKQLIPGLMEAFNMQDSN
ncbi:MAG: putative manganese-dependent inorganic diphosphatase [Lachnospiraceae bacterium]|nr:putative manganese-dependent inorganic diphosphatase [Lachnospiraceae bacterium]